MIDTEVSDVPSELPPDASVEAPAPDSPPDEVPPETVDAPAVKDRTDRGDGRDARGRFAPGQEGAPEEGAAEVPEAGEVADPEALAADPAALAAPVEVEEDEPAQPFVVRYGSQDFEVPGSQIFAKERTVPVKAGDMLIPAAEVATIRERAGQGVKYLAEKHEIKRALFEAKAKGAHAESVQREFSPELAKLWELAAIRDDDELITKGLAFLQQLREALPAVQARQQLAQREADIALREHMLAPDPEEISGRVATALDAEVEVTFRTAKAHPEFKELTDRDYDAVRAAVRGNTDLYAYQVGRSPTPDERAAGLRPGDFTYNERRVEAALRERLALRKEFLAERKKSEQSVKDAKKVAAENAKKLAMAVPKPESRAAPSTTAHNRGEDQEESYAQKRERAMRAVGLIS